MSDTVALARGLSDPTLARLVERDAATVVDFAPETGNCRLDLGDLGFGGPLGALHEDVVTLAAGIVMGDVAVPRGRNGTWERSIVYHAAVRCEQEAREQALGLASLLGFLMGDSVTIALEEWRGPEITPGRTRALPKVDCVCLLSGGIDSLAGACTLLEAGRRPLLVTHLSGNPTVQRSQRAVRAHIDRVYGRRTYVGLPLHVREGARTRHGFTSEVLREVSRRSRSLFPLTAAAVAAARVGCAEVFIPENGILAAQLPLTRARIGSQTTRTTHPRWLSGLGALLTEWLGTPIAIRNPLIAQTKAELVRDVLLPHLGEAAVRETVSCWLAGRRTVPCGACVPCILRRLAFETSDLAPEATVEDPLTEAFERSGGGGWRNLVAILGTVRDFAVLPEERLRIRYPEVAYSGELAGTVLGTLGRFAEEVREVAERRYPRLTRLLGL